LFKFASVFGQIPGAIGSNALCEIGASQRARKLGLTAQSYLLTGPAPPHKSHRSRTILNRLCQYFGSSSRRCPAHGGAIIAFGSFDKPRLPQRDGALTSRRSVACDLGKTGP